MKHNCKLFFQGTFFLVDSFKSELDEIHMTVPNTAHGCRSVHFLGFVYALRIRGSTSAILKQISLFEMILFCFYFIDQTIRLLG